MTDADLGPLADDPETLARARFAAEERRELLRRAAVSALQHSDNGRRLDPEARAWAKQWAAIKPLGRALSDGSPARAHSGEVAP